MALYDTFPYLENETIIIHKIEQSDLESLREITSNDNVYKFIPYFLYKKSDGNLTTAIRNLSGRDFIKKKMIIVGIYLKSDPTKLIGLAEMFDYKKRANCITIGYVVNESFWNCGIASNAVLLMIEYLTLNENIKTLLAFVMPENIYSEKALLKNGFVKLSEQEEQKNWGGMEKVFVDKFVYSKP